MRLLFYLELTERIPKFASTSANLLSSCWKISRLDLINTKIPNNKENENLQGVISIDFMLSTKTSRGPILSRRGGEEAVGDRRGLFLSHQ